MAIGGICSMSDKRYRMAKVAKVRAAVSGVATGGEAKA
jgi:hypothetical protein